MNNVTVLVPLVVSCLSGIVSILAIVNFVHAKKQEAQERQRQLEADAVWKASVNQQLDALTKRVDSHNHYAELFAQSKDDNAEMKADIAFIRGKLENK